VTAALLAGAVTHVTPTDVGVRASVAVPLDDPVFAGHYPGFALLPGVYLVDVVHQVVRAARPAYPRLRLAAVDRCRFRSPVYPGDELEVTVALADGDAGPTCSATVHTQRGAALDLRLSYEELR